MGNRIDPSTVEESGERVPWATGLTVTGIVAALVTVGLTAVSLAVAEVNIFLAIAMNHAAAAGFAPTIWLSWRTPVWRWVTFGLAAGLAVTWIALLLSTLG